MIMSGSWLTGLLSLLVSDCVRKKKVWPKKKEADVSHEMGNVAAPRLTKELRELEPVGNERPKQNDSCVPNVTHQQNATLQQNFTVQQKATHRQIDKMTEKKEKSAKKSTSTSQEESDAVSRVPSILHLSPEWLEPCLEPLVLLPASFQLPPTDTSKRPHKSSSSNLTKHQPSDKHRDRPTDASLRNPVPS